MVVRKAIQKAVQKQVLTTPQVAMRWGVGPDKIRGWAQSGELESVNLATTLDGRRRYGFTQEALDRFLRNRAVVPTATPVRRRRKQADVTEFV